MKRLRIFSAYSAYTGKEVWKQVRLFCHGIWRNFQGTNYIITLFFRFFKIQAPSKCDFFIMLKFNADNS